MVWSIKGFTWLLIIIMSIKTTNVIFAGCLANGEPKKLAIILPSFCPFVANTDRAITSWNELLWRITFEPIGPQKSYALFWKAETLSFSKQ